METKDIKQLVDEAKQAYDKGEYKQAAIIFERAAQSYQAQENLLLAAEMANNQSVALLQAKDPEAALEAVRGTEEVFQQAGEVVKQAIAIGNRAAALESLSRFEEAEAAYQRSADLLKENGEMDLYAHVMKTLSAVQIRQGKQLEALANMQAGMERLEKPSFKQRLLKKLLKIPYKFIRK